MVESNRALQTVRRIFLLSGIIGLFVFSPMIIGACWYFLIVREPISAAIIGVVCGVIFDILFDSILK